MEIDKIDFKIDLFPRVTKVAQAIGRFLTPFNGPVEPYMSDHYRPVQETNQPELPFGE
jgi:hypothetical protein